MAPTVRAGNVVQASETPNFRKSMRNVTPNERYRQFIAQAQSRRSRTKAKNSEDASEVINLAADSDDATLPTTRHQATAEASPAREDRHSNVTRRTKPGRGRSVPASKKDVSEPIVLKDCFVLLTDITKATSLAERQQQQFPVLDKNVTKSRTKRKPPNTTVPPGVSPPKKPTEESIVEIIPDPPVESAPVPVQLITMTTTTKPSDATQRKRRATKENNPFGLLIVSVKRLAPALSQKALQTLHNPEQLTETIRELEATQRQPVRETNRSSSTTTTVLAKRSIPGAEKKPRITFAKSPKIIVTACPSEDSGATRDSAAAAPPIEESKLFVKPQRSVNRRKEFGMVGTALPLLLEDEDEEGDVYEFLSSSQTVETKGKEKKSKKPKTAPQPRGIKKEKADPTRKPAAAAMKPARMKRESNKQNRGKQKTNPFGCNTKDIAKVVKKIGGGPVKTDHQPVDYVVNLDIEDFFHEPPFRAGRSNDIPLQDDDSYEPPMRARSPKRATNPTLERLRNPASLPLPLTSTPAATAAGNSVRSNGTSLLPPATAVSPLNVGSPWRLQEDHIVPPSRYVPRNREMLPSYDSHQNVPAPPAIANVTERRKTDPKASLPPEVGTVVTVGTPPQPPRPSLTKNGLSPEEVLSEANFREMERMYNELKATSAMSEKLIGVMRKYKNNMRHPAGSSTDTARQYEGNMREACQKLRQWYARSMQSFNRSMHIINQIQRGVTVAGRAAACPSPLSQAQQQTVENFNQSTDHFRSMLDELRDAMNDSNDENRSPPGGQHPLPISGAGGSAPSPRNPKPAAKGTKDVIVIPERAHVTTRNPLKSLNFVPLPQHDNPLMSPLAKPMPPSPAPLRRGLQFDQTTPRTTETVESKQSSKLAVPDVIISNAEPSPAKQTSVIGITNDDVVIEDSCDEFAAADPPYDDTPEEMENVPPPPGNHSGNRSGNSTEPKNAPDVDDFFGFDEEAIEEDLSEPQITLPMPLNISAATLKKRLNAVKQLLPERPIFRERPLERSSGPTRLPTTARLLRGVFTSPDKRSTRTLHAFAASTPRALEVPPQSSDRMDSNGATAADDHQPPNVSAIETTQPPEAVNDDENDPLLGSVVLFDEPQQNTFDRSTLQRTYTRIPRRKRAKNIYLANLGLSDDEDGTVSDDALAVSSDSDAEAQAARKKKEKQKKERRKARKKPVEETKEFKQFVEEFNSMCDWVEGYEVVIE
ncbi:uncharacterized protein LOC126571931 [Anopheles aquasalis]|uniref:uncharacterized protein LOC126571931 n=1 Tax=Anopheles aquasalis TaxID=42839 RepID=UPI00215B2663|nr:uncharacterized protein LOC126571931 [Anopheles aquasalis]